MTVRDRSSAVGGVLIILALIGFALIPGCAKQGATTTTVAQTELALTAAEKAATLYVTLPQCTTATRPICSEKATIATIKDADNTAFAAVMAARQGGDQAKVAAADAAVATLVSVIPATTVFH